MKYKSRRSTFSEDFTTLSNSQTSLAHLCDHFCLQRGPQRPVRHTQDNDNKPAIKAFKIQLEPGLELTPSNTFPAVLTHLGWGGPLEPGKGFFSFQQPSVYFHCNTRAKDTRHSNYYPVTRSPSQESDICNVCITWDCQLLEQTECAGVNNI